ncbi:phosphopantetheine binding protein [Yimella lutea]|uniref:Phosphopantetheine binding protein n=1 Tax=Yimella lutea TaxID=587872 RepID=A0A542EGY8_9MICO|nr:non-ribosomal peptide synthetase [Yimella lutea]TQJ14496.1 phosphopantetheine binding protein [Yimella lutea]
MPPQRLSLAEHIRDTANRTPNAVAIEHAERRITYVELEAAIEHLTETLRTTCPAGRFVGILGQRGPAAVIAIVASLRARRPFVILDDRDSTATNRQKVGLLGVALITGPEPSGWRPIVGPVPEKWEAHPGGNTRFDTTGVAYAIYTSGSTGQPKCVLVRSTPLATIIHDHVDRLEVNGASRTLQFARLTFDGCLTEILWTLSAGACLVIVAEDELAPGDPLQRTLERHRITHLKTTPFALTVTDPTPEMSLERVINGGGACRPNTIARWSSIARFHNAYGLTETTICNLLTRPLDGRKEWQSIPLGDVVGDCDVLVASPHSDHSRPVEGVPGELVITGDSVALGYLTASGVETFDEEFRTGDMVELTDNGLCFVQRSDRQVKVRGYRIDPGEIEHAVCRFESVRDAAVVTEGLDARERTDDALVCYYAGDADPTHLRAHLDRTLDPYKVPSVLERVDQLPHTSNGKVDIAALAAGRRERLDSTGTSSTPMDTLLQYVAAITGAPAVRPTDNFFDLGGDSASSLALVNKLRSLGWHDAGVRDVLRAQDVAALGDALMQRNGVQTCAD